MSGEILTNEEMRRGRRFRGHGGHAVAYLDGKCGTRRGRRHRGALRALPDRRAVRSRQQWRRRLCGRRGCWQRMASTSVVATGNDYKGDAAAMAAQWQGARAPLAPDVLDGAALVVDALFGAGLSRPLEGVYRALVEAVNRCSYSRDRHGCAQRH